MGVLFHQSLIISLPKYYVGQCVYNFDDYLGTGVYTIVQLKDGLYTLKNEYSTLRMTEDFLLSYSSCDAPLVSLWETIRFPCF